MGRLCALVVVVVAGCGSVSGKSPDAGVDTLPPGSATLMLADAKKWVPQGSSATVDFTIVRGASVTGGLTVHVNSLPAGVTAADVAIAAGATGGTITFSATTAAALASSTDVDVALLDGTTMLDHKAFNVFVSGAAGTVDTTFGTDGTLAIPLPDPNVAAAYANATVRAIAQYPSTAGANAGKVVIGVQLDTTGTASTNLKAAIVRLNADGTLDTTFNTSGFALLSASNSTELLPAGIAIDSQGRIAVSVRHFINAGTCNIYVTRLTATGAADTGFTTFDANPPGGYCGYSQDIVAIAGDKLVVLAGWNNPDGSVRPLLAQLNSDGSPDNTAFGSSYAIRLPNPDTSKPSWMTGRMYLDSQGRYVVVGSKCEGGYSVTVSACESVIGRITAAGAWDTTFGTAGAGSLGYSALTFGTTASTPQQQYFNSAAFDSAGNIVTVGWYENYASGTLAKWSSSGAIDTTFGTSGRINATIVSGATIQELDDVVLDNTGKVIGIGVVNNGGALAVATRYSATGTLDSTYGTAGVGTEAEAGIAPFGALLPDGRVLVIGGKTRTASASDLAAFRFWP